MIFRNIPSHPYHNVAPVYLSPCHARSLQFGPPHPRAHTHKPPTTSAQFVVLKFQSFCFFSRHLSWERWSHPSKRASMMYPFFLACEFTDEARHGHCTHGYLTRSDELESSFINTWRESYLMWYVRRIMCRRGCHLHQIQSLPIARSCLHLGLGTDVTLTDATLTNALRAFVCARGHRRESCLIWWCTFWGVQWPI